MWSNFISSLLLLIFLLLTFRLNKYNVLQALRFQYITNDIKEIVQEHACYWTHFINVLLKIIKINVSKIYQFVKGKYMRFHYLKRLTQNTATLSLSQHFSPLSAHIENTFFIYCDQKRHDQCLISGCIICFSPPLRCQ